MRVAVLMGGASPERDVSLASGDGIAKALEKRGYDVIRVDPVFGLEGWLQGGRVPQARLTAEPPSLDDLPENAELRIADTLLALRREPVDVAFIALHGGTGEDGHVQAVLDMAGLPYTGSGALASAVAMDKATAKRLFRHEGVITPEWVLLKHRDKPADATLVGAIIDRFELPVVVKPNNQGSTVGFSLVEKKEQLGAALEKAWQFDDALVEPFIPGREVTVAILDGRALPVVEIIPEHGVYDYECKYTKGKSRYVAPAELPVEVAAWLQGQAEKAFRALGCRDYARVDFRLRDDNTPFCLEVNTAPGMTELSLVPKAARAAGIEFDELCDRIVQLALSRKQQ